jgi:hypothetical protein
MVCFKNNQAFGKGTMAASRQRMREGEKVVEVLMIAAART